MPILKVIFSLGIILVINQDFALINNLSLIQFFYFINPCLLSLMLLRGVGLDGCVLSFHSKVFIHCNVFDQLICW